VATQTLISAGFAARLGIPVAAFAQTPDIEPVDVLTIDLTGSPDYWDPALTRSTRDWSILHSIFDSIVHLSESGEIVPLAAESVTTIDELTLEVTLRKGLLFHDGTPVHADAIKRGIEWVQQSEGPATGNFSVISSVEVIDESTARIVTSTPAAWLLSQLAVWLVLFPDGMTTETFAAAPVGAGPYRFVSSSPGSDVVLERNPDYFANSPKGEPIAERVTYRFVPESVTRIADLATGQADLVQNVPIDQHQAVADAGAEIIETPVLGVAFLRIATDVAPFDDPRVCQALNYAIDVETIAQQLVSTEAHRLGSLFPDARGIGFDPDLAPFAYDPERARALLEEVGVGDGTSIDFQVVSGERDDMFDAISSQLEDVGFKVTPVTSDLATFNSQWQDKSAAPIRFVTWRPMFDPHTLLSLMYLSTGPLSRFNDPDVDAIILAAAEDTDPASRASRYRELGRLMQERPGAVYLWNLTSTFGAGKKAATWQPRADDYVIATGGNGGQA
jgi:peptide/nickel transport system substrate-binding protein